MKEPHQLLISGGRLTLTCLIGFLSLLSDAAMAQTNVDVVNTPSVRVINPVLRVGGSVTVINPASIPVPVSGNVSATVTGTVDAQGSARNAVSSDCYISNLYPSGSGYCVLANVAAGQILVIESMLCSARIPTGIPFDTIVLQLQAPIPGTGLSTVNHFLPLTPTSNNYGGNSSYALIAPVKLYAFGASASSGGGPVAVSVIVQAGALPATSQNPSVGCSMAGVIESQ